MRRSAIFFAGALVAVCALVLGLELPVSAMGQRVEVPRLTIEELRPLIGTSDLILIDVRVGDEWKKSDEKIQGAVREEPEKYDQWVVKYPKEKTLVFY